MPFTPNSISDIGQFFFRVALIKMDQDSPEKARMVREAIAADLLRVSQIGSKRDMVIDMMENERCEIFTLLLT